MTDNKLADATAASGDLGNGRSRKRWIYLLALLVIVLMAAGLWFAWYELRGQWYENTDNAYVNGNLVQIMPRIPGTVTRIDVDDNDRVQKGQNLVELDGSDVAVALAQAEAALGQAVREVRGLFSAVQTARSQLALRQTALKQAQSDYQRRSDLARSGAVSREELEHARDALATARSALAAAQSELAAAQSRTEGTELATHPAVRTAAAQLRQAWLDDQRTQLPAPVAGFVARRQVQLGQQVQPGASLMAVVPLQSVWVDANFKETQLRHMRIGQAVTLTSDLYGDAVTYHGRIAGLGIGTGSAFALLPAQNASGNWIKIVQRLPVRIELDADELSQHPLRIGLSMNARVDLRDRSGPLLASAPMPLPRLQTEVFDANPDEIDALIERIITQNAGPLTAQQMQHDAQRDAD